MYLNATAILQLSTHSLNVSPLPTWRLRLCHLCSSATIYFSNYYVFCPYFFFREKNHFPIFFCSLELIQGLKIINILIYLIITFFENYWKSNTCNWSKHIVVITRPVFQSFLSNQHSFWVLHGFDWTFIAVESFTYTISRFINSWNLKHHVDLTIFNFWTGLTGICS